jgi:hypothetical protein
VPDPTCAGPDADALARLAADLVRADAVDAPDPPVVLAIGDRALDAADGGVDVAVLPLATAHVGGPDDPLTVLCRQRPDPRWAVVGLLADGWTIPPADADDEIDWRTLVPRVAPSRHPSRRRVRTLHLVSRSGAVAMAVLSEGDDVPDLHVIEDGGEVGGPCGPLPDALRRMVGLSTPPCPVTAVELWASLWLEAVAALASRRATWATVAHLHPASWLHEGLDGAITPQQLVVAGRAFARARGWDRLQVEAVTDPGEWDLFPSPEVASWADAGMFARLVVREVQPLWSSRLQLDRLLQPAVLGSVLDVLGAWGLNASPPGERAA